MSTTNTVTPTFKECQLATLEEEKNKASANKKPHWAKLIAYVKKSDFPSGHMIWCFGEEVLVGTAYEFNAALKEHNKGKGPKEFDFPAALSHATQVTRLPDNPALSIPSRQVPATEVHAPGTGPRGQFAMWSAWAAQGSHHNIDVRLRIDPEQGGDPNLVFHYQPMNDTGSDIQTLYAADYLVLSTALFKNIGLYLWTTPCNISTANGSVRLPTTIIQISVIAPTGDPANPYKVIMDWEDQQVVIMPTGSPCLSGDTMRNHLFFCTPKGNHALYIADCKTTLMKNMPA